jgi:hypothetical protein
MIERPEEPRTIDCAAPGVVSSEEPSTTTNNLGNVDLVRAARKKSLCWARDYGRVVELRALGAM